MSGCMTGDLPAQMRVPRTTADQGLPPADLVHAGDTCRSFGGHAPGRDGIPRGTSPALHYPEPVATGFSAPTFQSKPQHQTMNMPPVPNPSQSPRPDRYVPVVAAAVVILTLLATWFLTGCATMSNPLTRPVVRTSTNESVHAVTNTFLTTLPQPPLAVLATNPPAVAGMAPLIITNYVELPPRIFTNHLVTLVTNHIVDTATNYIVNPQLAAGIDTARRLNSALNPTPSGPLVDWSLTALGAVATIAAAWQTRRANQARQVGDTVIRAVETYPAAPALKEHITRVAQLTGAAPLLDRRVQEITPAISHAMADGRLDANELHSLAMDPRVGLDDIPEIYRKAFAALRENMPAVS